MGLIWPFSLSFGHIPRVVISHPTVSVPTPEPAFGPTQLARVELLAWLSRKNNAGEATRLGCQLGMRKTLVGVFGVVIAAAVFIDLFEVVGDRDQRVRGTDRSNLPDDYAERILIEELRRI
jgi:hypothetical protein